MLKVLVQIKKFLKKFALLKKILDSTQSSDIIKNSIYVDYAVVDLDVINLRYPKFQNFFKRRI